MTNFGCARALRVFRWHEDKNNTYSPHPQLRHFNDVCACTEMFSVSDDQDDLPWIKSGLEDALVKISKHLERVSIQRFIGQKVKMATAFLVLDPVLFIIAELVCANCFSFEELFLARS